MTMIGKTKANPHFLYLFVFSFIVFGSFGTVGQEGCGGSEQSDVYFYEEGEPVYDDVNYEGDWILRDVESEEEEDKETSSTKTESKSSAPDNELIEV
jgi:hypothetical protein